MRIRALVGGLVAFAGLAVAAAYGLTARTYVPPAAIAVANRFVERLSVGDLQGAYELTRRNAAVGETLAEFEVRLRRQLAIDAFPLRRRARFVGLRGGGQSYGNRMRRWIMGRKVDPDRVDLDYDLGLPFEIRLDLHERDWRVVFFQSHAS